MSNKCGKYNVHLREKKISPNGTYSDLIMRTRCKSWDCPDCRKIKARWIEEQIHKNFADGDIYLITLTYYHNGPIINAWKKLGSTWNKLLTYMRKKNKKFKFIRVIEPHKDNFPHLHIITDTYIDTTICFKYLTQQGFGWNANQKKISVTSAKKYISKYLSKCEWSKEASELRKTSKCRIVSASRGIKLTPETSGEWEIIHPKISDESVINYARVIIAEEFDNGAIPISVFCEKNFIRIIYCVNSDIELRRHAALLLDDYMIILCKYF